MAVHLLLIGKFKLLAGGGHSSFQMLATLLCPFALKLPFVAARLPNSCTDLAVSFRFFLFRLGQVFVANPTGRAVHRRYGRLERALRLLHDRALGNDHRLRLLAPSDEILTAISMLTL